MSRYLVTIVRNIHKLKESNQQSATINILLQDKTIKQLCKLVENLTAKNMPTTLATQFLRENIKIAKTIKTQDFQNTLKKLGNPQMSRLDEAIGIILFEEKNPDNLVQWLKAWDLVKESLCSKFKLDEAKQRIRESAKQFQDSDKMLLETVLSGNSEKAFELLKEDTISLIGTHIEKATSPQDKLDFYQIKEKTLESFKSYSNENFLALHKLNKELKG